MAQAATLLRTLQAVEHVLAHAESEADAYPALIAAIGGALGWSTGLWWTPERDGPQVAAGDGVTVVVPVRAHGRTLAVLEFAATEPDEDTYAALETIGSQIGRFAAHCRARRALRESAARRAAMLDVAFDCVFTMDSSRRILEVNRAAERTFGRPAADMIGREIGDLVVPPRGGLVVGGGAELTAKRADGSEFPVELVVTRPELPGPPLFYGYLRDVSERHAVERRLRRLAAEQSALRRVATAVAAEADPAELFGIVVEEAARLLEAQTAHLVRYEGEGERVLMVAGWARNPDHSIATGTVLPLDSESATLRVWRTGRPARVDTYEGTTGELAETLRSLGYRSAIAAPIVLGGRLWGAVALTSVDVEPFPEGAEQRVGDFAELAAQALANAEARAQLAASRARIVQAGDAARRRLERNLHDGAQQRLVSLSLTLRLAARRHGDDEELVRAGEELSQALEELRELARGIHPAVLTEYGLEPALRALAARSTLPVELGYGLQERLPPSVEAAAYYVISEALANVAKHAEASAVGVRVFAEDGRAVVEVADDGRGGADSAGSGLRGLADRVEALFGRLTVTSPAGAGTTLRAEMPCGEVAPPRAG
ncbi:GAF domain-containing protein [Candidatus Solirubrobacter pratensis]|uniref:GAF domain-containing protein n=1 Tax=Candidatus Solirubrobacter pratensis TaxID=1298857 RepID=UPI00040E4407|nr:GAF domain-containing protein [Candidatus Solirubrobacter pratensis]